MERQGAIMSTDDTTAAEHGADAETTIVPPPSDAPELSATQSDHDQQD
jgi:hypothetical protein